MQTVMRDRVNRLVAHEGMDYLDNREKIMSIEGAQNIDDLYVI